jgi:hypothetical protein
MSPDEQFFTQHPDRQARIRLPAMQQHIDKQRAVRWLSEQELAFRSLGPHDTKRRRILAYRVPKDNPMYEEACRMAGGVPILQIPFLAFADETIEDRDDILLPLIHEVMLNAAKQ